MKRKILLLADASSAHTQKWAIALAESGYTIGIFSLNTVKTSWHENYPSIFILNNGLRWNFLSKAGYFFALPALLKTIRQFEPDLVHAHYATSYGLLGSLSRFKPFFISCWGSDVFEFPRKSFFHRSLLRWNLSQADKVMSTSHAMKKELMQHTDKNVAVVHFGVDTDRFAPPAVSAGNDEIKVGLIKSMEDIYGIETVIEAARWIHMNRPDLKLRFYLVGSGSRSEHYKNLCSTYGIEAMVNFTGPVAYSEIHQYHQLLDVFLNVTIGDESFGVSVLEAMACARPVIVSKVPGLLEIVNEDTGLFVEKADPEQLAKAILDLATSSELRSRLGMNGRRHVLKNYQFDLCLQEMIYLYTSSLETNDPAETYIASALSTEAKINPSIKSA